MNEAVYTREHENEETAELKLDKTKKSLLSEVGEKVFTNVLEKIWIHPAGS